MNETKTVWAKIVIPLVLFVAVATMTSGIVAAQSATRTLPDEAVPVGEDFNVGIEALDYGTFCRIVETLPEGFAYVSSTLDPGSVEVEDKEDNIVKFTLFGESSFAYTAKAPSVEGAYTFSGLLEDDYKNEYPVGGDSEVIVGVAEPAPSQTPPSQDKEKNHVISPSPALTFTPMLTPTSALTSTPTISPTPSPSPTPGPTLTPTPTPEPPGFEAVFAIAGLLAVAYLVLRRKSK